LLRNPKELKPDGLIQDKSGTIFQGRPWLKEGCFAHDDDDDDENDDNDDCMITEETEVRIYNNESKREFFSTFQVMCKSE
jgi:hypothetical protein